MSIHLRLALLACGLTALIAVARAQETIMPAQQGRLFEVQVFNPPYLSENGGRLREPFDFTVRSGDLITFILISYGPGGDMLNEKEGVGVTTTGGVRKVAVVRTPQMGAPGVITRPEGIGVYIIAEKPGDSTVKLAFSLKAKREQVYRIKVQ